MTSRSACVEVARKSGEEGSEMKGAARRWRKTAPVGGRLGCRASE